MDIETPKGWSESSIPKNWSQALEEPHPEKRRAKLLGYIWMLTEPANNQMAKPDDIEKHELYDKFLELCEETGIRSMFMALSERHKREWEEAACHPVTRERKSAYPKVLDRPYDPEHTLETASGQRWQRALCWAALRLRTGVENNRRKNEDELDDEVGYSAEHIVFNGRFPLPMMDLWEQAKSMLAAALKDEDAIDKMVGPRKI